MIAAIWLNVLAIPWLKDLAILATRWINNPGE
jgi:hypothetical protein